MATYKGIQGYSVQTLTTDPTAEDTIGQLFYNSTSGKFKYSSEGAGAWSSGNDMTGTADTGGYCGIQTAALTFGGSAPGGVTNEGEIYDGTTWTETNNLNTSVYQNAGLGTTTAAINAGGLEPTVTDKSETWNGTCWTNTNDLNSTRRGVHGCGTQTAGFIAFGVVGASNNTKTESYDGTSWTELNDGLTARNASANMGTTGAAIAVSGATPPGQADCFLSEEWDGTCFTEGADVNVARIQHAGAGTSTLAMIFGGLISPAPPERVGGNTETWNGTSWSAAAELGTARRNWQGNATSGTTSAAMGAGGQTAGGQLAITEEWNDPVYTIKTVTTS